MKNLDIQPKEGILNHLKSKYDNGAASSENKYFDVFHSPDALTHLDANNMKRLEAASDIKFLYAKIFEDDEDEVASYENERDFRFHKAGVQHNVLVPNYRVRTGTSGYFRVNTDSFEYGLRHNVSLSSQTLNVIRKYDMCLYKNRYAPGITKVSRHFRFGELHSELDLPAVKHEDHLINDNKLQRVFTFTWKQFGYPHRDVGPAVIQVVENNATTTGEEYNKNTKRFLTFYKFGLRHRIDGPANIKYKVNNDNPTDEEYFLFGKKLSKKEYDELLSLPNLGEKVYVRKKGKQSKKITFCSFNNIKHRSNLPAVIETGPTGNIILEQYYQFGLIHNDKGSAVKKYFNSGNKKESIWYQFGKKHGNHVKFIEDGPISIVSYKCNYAFGLKHNEFGPAEKFYFVKECYNTELNIRLKKYYEMGQLHRDDGPAVTIYSKPGVLYKEIYYVMNKKHRLDGPAYIKYNEEGVPVDWHYFIFGNYITKDFLRESKNLDDIKRLYIDEGIIMPEEIANMVSEIEEERRNDDTVKATSGSSVTTDSRSEAIL